MKKTSIFALVSALFLLTTASPALAHNEIISTVPEAESTVEAGIIPITLHFEEAPLNLGLNKGNLIAIADAQTGEQLGAACAEIIGTDLTTTVDLDKSGEYRVLWRSTSDDGHVASGDYLITVENNTNYKTGAPGNQCFDENGVALKPSNQEPLSTKKAIGIGALEGLFVGIGFIVIGSVISALLIKRRQRKESKDYE
jgi:methionine-rich copper-binding protein CopC